VGPISETASYFYVADTKGWIPALQDVKDAPKEGEDSLTHREPRDLIFLEEYVLSTKPPAFAFFAIPQTHFIHIN